MAAYQRYKVRIAAFIITFLEIGTFKSFGVLVNSMKEDLDTNLMCLGFVISISHATGSLFAPVLSKITEAIGERFSIITGGLITVIGLTIGTFVDNLVWMGLLFALVGIGGAMSFIAGVVAVSKHYKNTKRSTAIGLAYSGGAFGVMICPPVAEQLMAHFGWRGALAVLGITNANLLVCGMLTQPMKRNQRQIPLEETQLLQKGPSNQTFSHFINTRKQKLLQPFQVLAQVPCFTAILVARVFSTIIYSGWAIFLVPHAVEKSISEQNAALLSSIGGIAAIFGRLLPGPILDKEYIGAVKLILVATLVNSAAYFADRWLCVFGTLSLAAVVNGFYFGLEPMIALPVSIELLGDELVQDGFSLTFMPSAFGEMLGGALIGYFFDHGIGWFISLSTISLVTAIAYAIPLCIS